jgi:hypothetical protein
MRRFEGVRSILASIVQFLEQKAKGPFVQRREQFWSGPLGHLGDWTSIRLRFAGSASSPSSLCSLADHPSAVTDMQVDLQHLVF